jgi:hypothetical protein
MRRLTTLLAALLLGAVTPPPTHAQQAAPPPIADNSQLIEEAYNQDPGVIQHISGWQHDWRRGDWAYTFVQEWPVGGRTNQLSYTIPLWHLTGTPAITRIGDVAVNYRYQLVYGARTAVAPRVSVVFPTGSTTSGTGAGAVGLQVSLPVSHTISDHMVTHWNLGATLTPSARNAAAQRATTTAWFAGASAVWHWSRTFDLMVETLWSRSAVVTGPGTTASSDTWWINPALRCAFNFSSGLQIVPGVGVPIGVGPSHGARSVFLYLSFEHPLHRSR